MSPATRSLLFLCVALVSSGPIAAESHAPSGVSDAQRRSLEKVTRENDFNTTRSLIDYIDVLGPRFLHDLVSLDDHDSWDDVGSGDNYAIEQFFNPDAGPNWIPKFDRFDFRWHFRKVWTDDLDRDYLRYQGRQTVAKPRVTGITYATKNPLSPPRYAGRVRTLTGEFYEKIPIGALTAPPHGQASLITDVFGPLYYGDVEKVLRKDLELLAPKGVLYTVKGELDDPSHHKVKRKNGPDISLWRWLESLDGKGIKVEEIDAFDGAKALRITHELDAQGKPLPLRIPELLPIDHKPGNRRKRQSDARVFSER